VIVSSTALRRWLPVLAAAALLTAAVGCGSDSSGESTTGTTASVVIPPPTSPLPPPTSTPSTTTGGGKKKPPATTTTPGPPGCSIPDAYQNFKYTGLECTAAVAVATEWDQNGKDCNTVDNPNVDEGYHRTCTIEGFTCTAKRDVHSDARFVSCTQGGQSIRFTWLPA
jgi:hypothetical protein